MLVLKRKRGERILLSDGVVITLVDYGDRGVKIGIEAPEYIEIVREEICDAEFLRRSRFVRPLHRAARPTH